MMIFAVDSQDANFGPNILNICDWLESSPEKKVNISCDMTTQSDGQHFW